MLQAGPPAREVGAGDCRRRSGADDRQGAEAEAPLRAFAEKIQDVTRNIMLGETPVVGAVNGWAVGGAFSWPMNCDVAIWDEGARGFFPELDHGLFVSGGVTWLLPTLIGALRTNDLFFSNRKVDAAELQAMGLASRVAPAGTSVEAAVELASHIADLPAAARAGMKRCVTAAWREKLEAALVREVDMLVEVLVAGDWKARIAANFTHGKAS